jgi:hypothetical protein
MILEIRLIARAAFKRLCQRTSHPASRRAYVAAVGAVAVRLNVHQKYRI